MNNPTLAERQLLSDQVRTFNQYAKRKLGGTSQAYGQSQPLTLSERQHLGDTTRNYSSSLVNSRLANSRLANGIITSITIGTTTSMTTCMTTSITTGIIT